MLLAKKWKRNRMGFLEETLVVLYAVNGFCVGCDQMGAGISGVWDLFWFWVRNGFFFLVILSARRARGREKDTPIEQS